jgi:arabinogalactan endo-1,4-beta-galactosidase
MEDPKPQESNLIQACDISFLPEVEDHGNFFIGKDNAQADALSILKEAGVNTIRLRLWKNPSNVHASMEEVQEMAERIREKDMKLWLTVHYSDSWADPGKQNTPAAWQGLGFEELADSVYGYTQTIMERLHPDYIQIGNEINSGFLWPTGNIWNQESQCLSLLNKGIQAVRDQGDSTKIMIHYAGINNAKTFFQKVSSLDYDAIGISYYPLWHGKDLDLLESTLVDLRTSFNKEVLIAETAYPFTLSFNDNTTNIIGSTDQILDEYPPTTTGQKSFLKRIKQIVMDSQSSGFAYWGACYIAFDGSQSTMGSSWENQALFGFNNQILKAAEVFSE